MAVPGQERHPDAARNQAGGLAMGPGSGGNLKRVLIRILVGFNEWDFNGIQWDLTDFNGILIGFQWIRMGFKGF